MNRSIISVCSFLVIIILLLFLLIFPKEKFWDKSVLVSHPNESIRVEVLSVDSSNQSLSIHMLNLGSEPIEIQFAMTPEKLVGEHYRVIPVDESNQDLPTVYLVITLEDELDFMHSFELERLQLNDGNYRLEVRSYYNGEYFLDLLYFEIKR